MTRSVCLPRIRHESPYESDAHGPPDSRGKEGRRPEDGWCHSGPSEGFVGRTKTVPKVPLHRNVQVSMLLSRTGGRLHLYYKSEEGDL